MSTELQVIERAQTALGFVERKAQLTALAHTSVRIVAITNTAGRDECHAAAMVLKNTRVDIQKVGKEAREDATKFSKAVIVTEGELVGIIQPEETRLLAIRDAYDKAIEDAKLAEAAAETARVEALQAKVDAIRAAPGMLIGQPADALASWLSAFKLEEPTEEVFGELIEAARYARESTIARVQHMHTAQVAHEAEQAKIIAERAELAELRAAQDTRLEAQKKAADEARGEADRIAGIERDRLAEAARAEAKRLADIAAEQAVKDEAERVARIAEDAKADAAREAARAAQAARDEATHAEQVKATAELTRQNDELARQRDAQAEQNRAHILANTSLFDAATSAHALLVANGFAANLTTKTLAAALARDVATREKQAAARQSRAVANVASTKKAASA